MAFLVGNLAILGGNLAILDADLAILASNLAILGANLAILGAYLAIFDGSLAILHPNLAILDADFAVPSGGVITRWNWDILLLWLWTPHSTHSGGLGPWPAHNLEESKGERGFWKARKSYKHFCQNFRHTTTLGRPGILTRTPSKNFGKNFCHTTT